MILLYNYGTLKYKINIFVCMESRLSKIVELINSFSKIQIKERNELTYLEIIKCAHLENVWTNILAFYFDPNNKHNFYELFLKSLFEAIKINFPYPNLKSVKVKTEFYTKKGNKLDLIIFADNFLIGIENKINADLFNDFEDYSSSIESIAKARNLPFFNILLSKNPCLINNGFINIRYTDFIKSIKQNLGGYTAYSDTKYLLFLLDFLNNIEKQTNFNNMDDNLEVIDFLQKNVDQVNTLIEYHNKFIKEFVKKLDNIDKKLKLEELILLLNMSNKVSTLTGASTNKVSGRFRWNGSSLIKYNIKIGEISLFYQIGFTDYKLHSHYWFENNNYQNLLPILIEKGINRLEFGFNDSDDSIAQCVLDQMKQIIIVLHNHLE